MPSLFARLPLPHRTNGLAWLAMVGVALALLPPSTHAADVPVSPVPSATPSPAAGLGTPTIAPTASASPVATPRPTPTSVPLVTDPSEANIPLGSTIDIRANGVWGMLAVHVTNPQIATVSIDQDERVIHMTGHLAGETTAVISDQRGTTRTLPILVAPYAGTVGSQGQARITGDPASASFVAEIAGNAALSQVKRLPGATVTLDQVPLLTKSIEPDEIMDVDVPLTISGKGYFTVHTRTTVHIENVAQPPVRPSSLLVSDFPEKLTESGLLFTSRLRANEPPTRLMFYHYNPHGQPSRHIVLRAKNQSKLAANVQVIDGHGGPDYNERLVGHLATKRFLLRAQQNEGQLMNVPGQSSVALVDASLPPGMTVNDMMQLRQIDGYPLDLSLTAETRGEGAFHVEGATPLTAQEHHARGLYPIPQFFYETTYTIGADPVSIPIGQLPLPNLRHGEALKGDYGVEVTIDATIINPTAESVPVALYANPRGGAATGTFIIDRAVVQLHNVKQFTNYKLRQYIVPAHGLLSMQVITMPEGGSSYPLNLVLAPDDGSVAPNAPGSPVY